MKKLLAFFAYFLHVSKKSCTFAHFYLVCAYTHTGTHESQKQINRKINIKI